MKKQKGYSVLHIKFLAFPTKSPHNYRGQYTNIVYNADIQPELD